MDVAQLNFTSKPGKTCNGCLFDESHSSVCREACAAAVRASMPDCDKGVIYVLVETDPRQLALIGGDA